MRRSLVAWSLCVVGSAACSESAPELPPVIPGELIGRVEIAQDVPASNCQVILEGTPLGARCDAMGQFDLRRVPPGRWDLRISPSSATPGISPRRISVAANPSFVSDLGTIRLSKPGSLGGRLRPKGQDAIPSGIVAIPFLGAATATNPNGGFLLEGVPPGVHDVMLMTDAQTILRANILVQPGKITVGVDFDLTQLDARPATLSGLALRAGADVDGHGGLTVELVEALDGNIIATTQSADAGAFVLSSPPGFYLVRARDKASKSAAVAPAVVLSAGQELALPSPLLVYDDTADLDGDGRVEGDSDRDGDGVPDAEDAFPFDPGESADTDKDGVGDNADLRSQGGTGIDHQAPTPDGDKDGLFDFEDNCPGEANADQADLDRDAVGDACDNCASVPNPLQEDTQQNGTGDACRACKANADCPGGTLCQFGQCVQCIHNAQCGDQVCVDGACVGCGSTAQCSGGQQCHPELKVCQECLATRDCKANERCVFGACLPQCTKDDACPGGFCADGACAQCRDSADCPGSEWCDNGLCRPQCLTARDCTAGRVCETSTRTCVVSCSATCPQGQLCDKEGICRQVCETSGMCPSGQKCNVATSLCGPQCLDNGDCQSFHQCQAGQCVPDGTCARDPDCAVTERCTASVCVPRPTAFVEGKGYACSAPCDCRLGEICGAEGYCSTDGLPTIYVAQGGSGAGLDPLSPAGDLVGAVLAAPPGAVVALVAGDTHTLTSVLDIPSRLTVGGGYLQCSPSRWVRDPSARTLLVSSAAGVLSIAGDITSERPDVVISGLDLSASETGQSYSLLEARFATRLRVRDITLRFPTASSIYSHAGVKCTSCLDVKLSDLDMPSITSGGAPVTPVSLHASSGLVERVVTGTVMGRKSFVAIDVESAAGILIVDRAKIASVSVTYGGAGIRVRSSVSDTVTVSNNHIEFAESPATASRAEVWSGIDIQDSSPVLLKDNTIDGTLLKEASTTESQDERNGIRIINSAGVVDKSEVVLPLSATARELRAYSFIGPRSDITFTNNTSSGRGARWVRLLYLGDITSGTFYASRNALGHTLVYGTVSDRHSAGLLAERVSAGFQVEDSTFTTGSGGIKQYGVYAYKSSGRIERCQFWAVSTTGNSEGVRVHEFSQIELYSSYVVAVGDAESTGFYASSAGQLHAVGNTIEGRGHFSNCTSRGLWCDSTSLLFLTSNLVSGGRCGSDRMAEVGSCAVVDNFRKNYFWHEGTTYGPYENVSLIAPAQDERGNVVGGKTGCYDLVSPIPYDLAKDSACVDTGPAALVRRSGSAITIDLDGRARAQGAATDIGCWEAK
jgi:hypothetical protein